MRQSVGLAKRTAVKVVEREQELNEFREAYEALLDTICDAAHYGPSEKLDADYSG